MTISRKLKLCLTMLLLAAIWAGFYSCKKSISGISNNQVVETPFSLYFSDSSGGLYSSNDGKNIRQTLFKADGYPSKASANSLVCRWPTYQPRL